MKPPRAYPIAVLGKAFNLLDLLEGHQPLSLTELSDRAGLDKATAYRILTNLESRGYVERGESSQYRLGVRLMQLGMRVTDGLYLRKLAQPLLESLQAEFDETVNLAVPGKRGVVYIEILESAQGLRMAAAAGAQDEFHSTAIGKAILAFWPTPLREEFLASAALPAKTPNTIVDPDALRSELGRVRERGYATDNEENEVGARCVGAPVFDRAGRVIAAISVSGPASRLTSVRIAAVAVSLLAASQRISARMGYQPTDGEVGATPALRKGDIP